MILYFQGKKPEGLKFLWKGQKKPDFPEKGQKARIFLRGQTVQNMAKKAKSGHEKSHLATLGQTKKGGAVQRAPTFSAFYSIFITKLLAELPKNGEKIFFLFWVKKIFWSNFWIRPEKARFWENLWIRPEKARFFRIRPYGQNFFSAARQVQIRPKRPNLAARAASWQLWARKCRRQVKTRRYH